MTIFERLSQILLANINDLLDQAEDPEKMLNQYVRAMESQKRQAREVLVEMVTQEKVLEADWTQQERDVRKWNEIAAAAARQGKDELARESLLRKRSSLQIAELYEAQLTSQRHAVSQIKAQMSALETKYRHTLGQRDLLIARQRRARAQESVARSLSAFVIPEPGADIERIERRVRANEAHAAAYVQVAGEALEAQLLSLTGDLELEQELALLKGELGLPAALPQTTLSETSSPGDGEPNIDVTARKCLH